MRRCMNWDAPSQQGPKTWPSRKNFVDEHALGEQDARPMEHEHVRDWLSLVLLILSVLGVAFVALAS